MTVAIENEATHFHFWDFFLDFLAQCVCSVARPLKIFMERVLIPRLSLLRL
jgi:hypothetical protein